MREGEYEHSVNMNIVLLVPTLVSIQVPTLILKNVNNLFSISCLRI